MSDLGGSDDPIFRGRTPGGISCEAFVRAVRKHAMIEKKARDYEYLTDYAMSCLGAEALQWSEKLSMEVQGDWNLLRRALLAEYGVDDQSTVSLPASISSTLIPIPAAAPPSQPPPASVTGVTPGSTQVPSAKKKVPGRIRIVIGSVSKYLRILNEVPVRCVATPDIDAASALEAVETDGGIELLFMSPALASGSWLGMVWEPKTVKIGSYAALLPVTRLDSKVINPTGIPDAYWEGVVSVVKCTRSADGFLAPILGAEEGLGGPVTWTQGPKGTSGHYIYITNDFQAFKEFAGPKWEGYGARFVFEPF